MPKGVYTRSKPINTVTVSELPERQSANANVESIPQTDSLNEESTTTRLFGDIAERDELDKTDPNRTAEVLQTPIPVAQNPDEAQEEKFNREPSPAPKPEEVKPETPEMAPAEKRAEQPDDFLDWEKLSGKKIRQKVDGKEVIVTAEDLKKYSDQDQIKKHLADEANKVGDERRKLAEERRQLQELRQQRAPQYEAPINGQPPQGVQPSQSDPFLQRIEFLEARLQQLAQGTQPVIYQSNRQRVSDELKAQGFDDFMDYIPKMEVHMGSVQDPQLASFYDTPSGAKALYFQLKAQDMRSTRSGTPPAPVSARAVQSVQPTVSNPVPPATQIDGGSPASGSFNDDAGHNYRAAFRRAQASGGNKEAWNEVLRQKGILPEI